MKSQITATKFFRFKISDRAEPCASCAPHNPNQPAAPVVIEGQHFCVWCALEIARNLLGSVQDLEETHGT
jgi:hypothetical protein